jgi:hypothetical protein
VAEGVYLRKKEIKKSIYYINKRKKGKKKGKREEKI